MRLLAVALLMGGCTAEVDEPPLVLDPDFTLEQRLAVESGLARWDAVTRPWDSRGWRIELGTPPHASAGWTYGDEKRIVMLPGTGFEVRVTHEIGHAHGLDHVLHGVMQGGEGVSGPSSANISEDDMVECRRVKACP